MYRRRQQIEQGGHGGGLNHTVLPNEDRELFIYNIYNSNSRGLAQIHLQKALLTLGKNSVSILFTLSQAVQPFRFTLLIIYIHRYYIYTVFIYIYLQ